MGAIQQAMLGQGAAAGAPSTLLDGLVAFWKLGEASGTRNDSVGSNHLTDNNTVTQAVGKVGNCAQFTAANSEYLSIADNADLSTGDIDFTFAGWTYLDTKTASKTVLSKWSTGQLEYILYYDSSGDRFNWLVGDAGAVRGSVVANAFGAVPTATWIQYTVWHDAANNLVGIRINDTSENTAATSGAVGDGTASFYLGAHDATPTFFWDGKQDALGFWKRLLTTAENTEFFNSTNGKEHPF